MFGSLFQKSPPAPSEKPSSPTTFRTVERTNPANTERFELTTAEIAIADALNREGLDACPGEYAKTHAFVYDFINGKISFSCVPTKNGSYYEASKNHRCVPGFKNPPSFQPGMPKPENPENTICMKMPTSGGRRTRHKKRKVRKGKSRKYRRY